MTDGSPPPTQLDAEAAIVLGDSIAAAIFASAPDGQVIVDSRGRIVLANPQAEQMFGWAEGEMVGLLIEDLVPERFRDTHVRDREAYHGQPHTRPMGLGMELRARRRDGSELPVEISLSPVATEVGTLVIAAVRDVSERVAREAHAHRIQRSLDAINDGVFMFHPATLRFTYVNQGALEQAGRTRAELLEMGLVDLVVDGDADQLAEVIRPLVERRRGSRSITTRHRRADGSTLPVEVMLQVPDLGTDIEPTVVAVVRDISERIEQDERLRAAHQELQLAEDRERIARELHDTVIQRLFATGMGVQALAGRVEAPEVAERLGRVVDDLDTTIRDIRTAIFGLQGGVFGAGVRAEVLKVAHEASDALGFEPRVRFLGPVDAVVGPEVADQLIPTLREALSNVARHAAATQVEVTLRCTSERAHLQVVDDGVGPPSADDDGGPVDRRVADLSGLTGRGLRNVAGRAEALGGTCVLAAGPDGGAVLEWQVPLDLLDDAD